MFDTRGTFFYSTTNEVVRKLKEKVKPTWMTGWINLLNVIG
ncbi:hypothetical protein [Tuberibacillus calidus]|jgi:hypothetical protein|nr:hypothetical protein [Tuberibacillus calidus]